MPAPSDAHGAPGGGGPVVHIALARQWADARTRGQYRISTRGRTLDDVGFIHASRPGQVDATLRRFYADVTEPLVLLTIDPARLDCAVVDEPGVPGGDELFPHIYGPIPVAAVVAVTPLTVGDDSAR